MSRTQRSLSLPFLVLLFSTVGCRWSEPPAHPNVLLISIDSLRADHVGTLGYERDTTPAIDRLADDAAVFENAVSSSSWTLPAHTALLTGLADAVHGVKTPRNRLREGITTLAEELGRSGYTTVGFYSGPFLDPAFGLGRGFDRYIDCTSYGTAASGTRRSERHAASHADRTNENLRETVLRELDRLADRPFFFFVHLWDVHYDLIAPAPYDTMFDPSYGGSFDGAHYRHNPAFRSGMAADDLDYTIALYDGEVRYTDDTIGAILAAVDQRGLSSDTLVVITADHGDEFLDHGGKGHRHTLYNELIRIPLVIAWPGVVRRARFDEVVSIVDVAPTILDLAGLPAVPSMNGRSLVPLMRGERSAEPVPAFAELTAPPGVPELHAIVLGAEKVVLDPRADRAWYYDLRVDPEEREPRNAKDSDAGRRLLTMLEQRRAALAAPSPDSTRTTLSEQLQNSLGKLGYLE